MSKKLTQEGSEENQSFVEKAFEAVTDSDEPASEAPEEAPSEEKAPEQEGDSTAEEKEGFFSSMKNKMKNGAKKVADTRKDVASSVHDQRVLQAKALERSVTSVVMKTLEGKDDSGISL